MKIKVKLQRAGNLQHYGVPKDTIIDIEIEEYLVGVVSSEIQNSHPEACKAQAIAARTFAMRRMKNRGVLTDGSGDQVFNVNYKYANPTQAVKDTAGMILTYKGSLLLDSPYGASNGGKTRAYKNYPYLIEQDDPWDAAETALRLARGDKVAVGNRYGLSQYGARYAANNGIGYRDILGFYYPNADITNNYGEEVKGNMGTTRQLNAREKQIVEYVNKQVGMGYVWGSVGQTLTESSLAALMARHAQHINPNVVRKWMGRKVFDCAGLITSVFSNYLGTRVVSGVSSQWKGNYWDIKGTIDTLPKDHVVFLYRTAPTANPMQHGGVYTGDGMVVDARGSSSGVLKSKLTSYPWTHWGVPRGLLSAEELAVLKAKVNGTPLPPSGGNNTGTNGGGTMKNAIVTGKQLALRVAMNTNNTPIDRLPTGMVVEIIEKVNNKWWKIKANGKTGYSMAEYLTDLSIGPVNPSAPDNSGGGQDEVENNQFAIHILCKDRDEAEKMLRLLKGAVLQ